MSTQDEVKNRDIVKSENEPVSKRVRFDEPEKDEEVQLESDETID